MCSVGWPRTISALQQTGAICVKLFFYRVIKYFIIPNSLIGFIASPYMNNYIIQTAYETILNFQNIPK